MSPELLQDPYPMIERARARCPIAHNGLLGAYHVYSHEGVAALLRDRTTSRDPRRAADGPAARMLQSNIFDADVNMLFLDPPEHTRLRGLVSKAFTPRAIDAFRPRIEAITNALLDRVDGKTSFDLMTALADPLPTIVIAEMLGIDPSDHVRFKQWSETLAKSIDPFLPAEDKERVAAARDELVVYVADVVAARRRAASPGDDLIGRLVGAEESGECLTDREIGATVRLLLVAGNVTTTDLIGNGMLALLQHPDQADLLRREPARLSHAVEEMLRYDPPVLMSSRVPTTSLELEGFAFAPGDTLVTSLAGANRDPGVYPEPARFDIRRSDVHHHSFGGGIHFCLGAHLARLEAQVAIGSVLSRFPHLRLDPQRPPERATVVGFRGLTSLGVAVS